MEPREKRAYWRNMMINFERRDRNSLRQKRLRRPVVVNVVNVVNVEKFVSVEVHLDSRCPWWSQPMCQACYTHRVGVPCTVVSDDLTAYGCFLCGGVADAGIFLEAFPKRKRSRKEMIDWILQHIDTEYAQHMIRNNVRA